jgi:hypothetical protein
MLWDFFLLWALWFPYNSCADINKSYIHLYQCQLDLCDNLKNTKFCINMTSEGVYIFFSGIFLCNENVYTLCYVNNISKVWYLFFICPFLHILHKKSITTSQNKWTMFYIPPWQLNEWICPWFFFMEIYNYVVVIFFNNFSKLSAICNI